MVSTPKPTNQQQQRFRLIFDKLKFLLVHFFPPLLFLLNSFFHGKNKSEVDLGMGKICYNPGRNAAATPPEPAWIRCLKRGEEMDAGDQGEAHKGRKLEHRPTNNQLHTHTDTTTNARAVPDRHVAEELSGQSCWRVRISKLDWILRGSMQCVRWPKFGLSLVGVDARSGRENLARFRALCQFFPSVVLIHDIALLLLGLLL